jgi:hypothetical protein
MIKMILGLILMVPVFVVLVWFYNKPPASFLLAIIVDAASVLSFITGGIILAKTMARGIDK